MAKMIEVGDVYGRIQVTAIHTPKGSGPDVIVLTVKPIEPGWMRMPGHDTAHLVIFRDVGALCGHQVHLGFAPDDEVHGWSPASSDAHRCGSCVRAGQREGWIK